MKNRVSTLETRHVSRYSITAIYDGHYACYCWCLSGIMHTQDFRRNKKLIFVSCHACMHAADYVITTNRIFGNNSGKP